MCGTTAAFAGLGSSRSLLDLQGALDSQEPTGSLKSAKSYGDLSDVVGLSRLRIDERDPSMQSGSDDTGRSSPTEHLLRSRSPCAVLFASEEAAGPTDAHASAGQQQQQQVQRQGSECAPRCNLLPADTFLESAVQYSVVDVPLAAARATASSAPLPPFPAIAGTRLPSPATVAAADDPIAAAAAASQQAMLSAAASAASSLTSASAQGTRPSSPQAAAPSAAASADVSRPAPLRLPPRPSLLLPQPAAALQLQQQQHVQSPFARLAMADHPSVITPAPGLLSQNSGGFGACSRQSSLVMQQPPSLLGGCCGQSDPGSSGSCSPTAAHSRSGSVASEAGLPRRGSNDGWGTSTHLSEGHAAEELFYRLNHARQTVDFVKRQATAFSQLNKAEMGVWEALELLNTLREYETALLGSGEDGPAGTAADAASTPDMPLLEHALQCAEACRAAFPDEDYMHLAGLLAPLGKLLAHAKFGAEPQWAICGETFPVGCRFHPSVRHSQYFSANPDRRKRLYSSPSGVYREGCGLGSVLMSWGAGEYLHLVLRLNRAALPPEALFCLRHQKLRCVFRGGSPYSELLSEFDRVQLPRLRKFQELLAYRRHPRGEPLLVPAAGAVPTAGGDEPVHMDVAPRLKQYYDALLAKYIPNGVLRW